MKLTFLLLFLCFVACKKEASVTNLLLPATNYSMVIAATELTPLMDMGNQFYHGFRGGLYPNGSNAPSGIYAKDLTRFAKAIVPLNTAGTEDSINGRVVFISIGASTCNIMMETLIEKTMGNPLTNPKLKMASCTSGSTSVNEIMDSTSNYWKVANRKMKDSSITAQQVQVIYMETDDSVQTNIFPDRPLRTKVEFQQALRLFKIRFPNIKLVYLLGRASAFKEERKNKVSNTEPCPYFNGWACKWVIEDQINQVAGTEYKGKKAVSPLVTWGWYEWGNSIPRSDGFTWTVNETSDSLHANDAGADSLATRFQNFLLTDRNARIWYGKRK